MPFGGKKKPRKQLVRVFTGDRRIVRDELDVMYGYVVDNDRRRAFFLPENALAREGESVGNVLALDERSSIPLYLGNGIDRKAAARTFKAERKAIAREHLEAARSAVRDDEQKDKMAATIRFVVLLVAIVAVVMIAVGLFTSGNLNLPWGS